MAKAKPLADLTDDEVDTKLREARQELFNLRFQSVTGQLDNNAQLRKTKKDIARALTELRAREIVAAEALAAGRS